MAKKSAASKGYRKVKKEKPFLSKNELIALGVIVGLILLGILLFNLLYDDGFVAPREIKSGDVISRANTNVDNRYMRVATINELEGYSMEASTSPEKPTGGYIFTPEAEGDLKTLRVSGAIWDAPTMMNTVMASLQSMGGSEVVGPIQATINDDDARICTIRFESTDEETQEISHSQLIYTYVTVGEYSVAMTATLEGADESIYIPDEELEAYMQQFAGAYTPVEVK